MPSIDLVQIQSGVAVVHKVPKKWKDTERGHRALGFRRLLEKFQDKVR